MSGTVTITGGGTQLAITTTASYQPVFLTSIGLGPPQRHRQLHRPARANPERKRTLT